MPHVKLVAKSTVVKAMVSKSICTGKHIPISCPRREVNNYFHYKKGFHSVVLLGLVDADYKFIWFDITAPG